MKEIYKLFLGGLWMSFLVITSVWLLSLFQDDPSYQIVVLVWAFAFLGGLQFSSYCEWAREVAKKRTPHKKDRPIPRGKLVQK